VPERLRVAAPTTDDSSEARGVYEGALAAGHEGLVAKALDAPYEAGRRGRGWCKLKRVRTLDLVVIAAEWGSGRRRGKLINLHLAAREADGGFAMLGKTFKGLSDEMLEWRTRRLSKLALEPAGPGPGVLPMRPELVVEVAFDGLQESPQYPAGLALRFARVRHHRPDRTASSADTIETARALFAADRR
jgi:DNA ligase-1